MIDTKKVPRRIVRLRSLDELVLHLDQIEAAHNRGSLAATGNWTPGQILAHLAAWIEYGWDGYPIRQPPRLIRWVMRLMLPRILQRGMKPGVRIPGVREGTTGLDSMDTLDAIARYRTALRRLAAGEPAKYASPAFGPMSEENRIRLQLRHAELHLSYLSLGDPPDAVNP